MRTEFARLLAMSMAVVTATALPLHSAVWTEADRLPLIVPNDNRRPAGRMTDGVLQLELRAGVGVWRPGGEHDHARRVEAFGELASPLSAPAPLVRVTEGTEIAAAVSNDLTRPLRVHGLCTRGGQTCAPIDVAPGQTRRVRFSSGPAGTYHYWATTTGMPQSFRGSVDTQLSGAFIVDPAGLAADPDRVLVITEWTSLTPDELRTVATAVDPGVAFLKIRPDVLFVINGRAWPETERLAYTLGERVRWRVLNLSTQVHPMHLHGFYFDVNAIGDGVRHRPATGAPPHVVTQLMPPGTTMDMTWIPERTGNWLFHCHVLSHISPSIHVDGTPKPIDPHAAHGASAGMTGMVLGVTITDEVRGTGYEVRGTENAGRDSLAVPRTSYPVPRTPYPPRHLSLLMRAEPKRFGDAPAYGFVLSEGAAGPATRAPVEAPGPTLVLTRDEPVEIALINQLPEGTAIHWHGMELDSYYDGVHGFGGSGGQVTPMIGPGETFVVRFTPPRTGTFIYHTHLHDDRQLGSGLYGALIVVDPNEDFDPEIDHVLVIGRGGPGRAAPAVINGVRDLQLAWRAGMRHRVRLINITPDDIVSVSLQTAEAPVTWRGLTKDGAPVTADRSGIVPARQVIGVGETYDFELVTAGGRHNLWLDVKTPAGRWLAQAPIVVR